MRSDQSLKTALAITFTLGAIAAPAASAQSAQAGWVVRPNPDQQAAQLAPPAARPAETTGHMRPNPDQQNVQTAQPVAAPLCDALECSPGGGAPPILRPARASEPPAARPTETTGHMRANPDQLTPVTAPTTIVRVSTPSGGFDWGDAGIGATGALGLSMLGVGGALAVSRRRGRRSSSSSALTG
jgi:hypothetical protein